MRITPKQIAYDLICDHAFDIEWSSIGDEMFNLELRGQLPYMTVEESEEFQREVDDWIRKASISVLFEEDE